MTAPNDHTPPNMIPPPGHGPFTGTVKDWPLWFVRHNFTIGTYDVQSYRIVYAGFPYTSDGPRPSLASVLERYHATHGQLYGNWRISIANFPPPAELEWVSKDGTSHHATADMAEIFRDKLIRHNVPREEVLETASIPDPGIVLEIDDRTVNVYMTAFIPTKHLQIPGNAHSDFRDDLIKVYSKTY